MPLLRPAQRTGGEHTDRDHAHVRGFGMSQQIAEIMRRVAWGDLCSGARVEQIIADLGGAEEAGVYHLMGGSGISYSGNAQKAPLSFPTHSLPTPPPFSP